MQDAIAVFCATLMTYNNVLVHYASKPNKQLGLVSYSFGWSVSQLPVSINQRVNFRHVSEHIHNNTLSSIELTKNWINSCEWIIAITWLCQQMLSSSRTSPASACRPS